MSEENKAMVRRMVEGINAGVEEATVDELFAPRAARRVKRLFAEFRTAFPDWQEELVQLVAEGDAVAARKRTEKQHAEDRREDSGDDERRPVSAGQHETADSDRDQRGRRDG